MKTLGDHIRAKRLDLGLFQKTVAGIIGATADTITNWEKGRNQPLHRYHMKINKFLRDSSFD